MNITNPIKKIGKKLWKPISLATLLGTFLFPKITNAGGIDGQVFDAWNGQTSDSTNVEVIINDGSSGTEYSKIPEWGIPGYWGVSSGNFSPWPDDGDTTKMSASLTIGPKTYTSHSRSIWHGVNLIHPTTFLDDPDKAVRAHAFGIWNVADTSNVSDTLRAEGWLQKNPDQKISFWNYGFNHPGVDTSLTPPHIYLNLEKQDSLWNQGNDVTIRLFKQKGDTIWESDTTFALDTLKYGGATMLDSLIFPERKIVIDNQPPVISNVTSLNDQDSLGSWLISADINDASGIQQAWLLRKVNGVPDSALADSNNVNQYFFTFPAVALNYPYSQLEYAVKAIDASSNHNQATSPWKSFRAYPRDLRLEQMLLPFSADSGSIIVPKVVASNLGIEAHQGKFKAQIGAFYVDSLDAILNGQTTDTLTFKPCSLNVAPGNYDAIMRVKLDGDVNPANDSLQGQIAVKLPYRDIELLGIVSPPDSVDGSSSHSPAVNVKNQGSQADTAKLLCEIKHIGPDSLVYSDTSKLYVPADSSRELQFVSWNVPSDGEWYAVKFKNLIADSNASNDSLMKQVYVKKVGCEEFRPKENIIRAWPIPCHANSYLNLWLPKDAKARVYDMAGRYVNGLENKNGSALWDFKDREGRRVGAGAYFIRIESSDGRKRVEKAILFE